MTDALSNDLRERVVRAIEGGESCRSVAPARMGGRRKPVLEAHRAFIFIVERIGQTPHLTLTRAEGRSGGTWG